MSATKLFWLCVGGAYALLSLVSLVLFFFPTTILGIDWNWGFALFLLVVVYTIASFKTIEPTLLGVRIFLGKPIDHLTSGFVFVPYGIFVISTAPANIIQSELPGNPEQIFHGEGTPTAGMFPPIRIAFGPPTTNADVVIANAVATAAAAAYAASPNGVTAATAAITAATAVDVAYAAAVPSNDPLNERMTAAVVPIVSWILKDFKKFITQIGTIDLAKSQMEDTIVALLAEAFAKITPAVALKRLQKHSDELKKALIMLTHDWGIELISVRIKVINFSKTLNTAILNLPMSKVTATASLVTATAAKEVAILEGQGKGAAEKAVLEGRTAGLKDMMDRLSLPGSAVLGAETARGITNNAGQKTVIVGADGFGKLAAVASTILKET